MTAGRTALRILEEEAKLQADAVQASQLTEERAADGVLSRRFTSATGLVRALGGGGQPDAK